MRKRQKVLRNSATSSFTLIEVVIAMGIMSFVVVGIIGLWALGLRAGSDSSETTAAANLASLIVNNRRLYPTQSLPSFALPALNQTTNNYASPVYVGADGFATNLNYSSYGLVYNIVPQTRYSTVYFVLFWPAQSSLTNAVGRFEINTQVALP